LYGEINQLTLEPFLHSVDYCIGCCQSILFCQRWRGYFCYSVALSIVLGRRSAGEQLG